MNKTVEFSNMLNEDIISKALSIHDMSTKRTTLEEDNQTKLAKLSTLKKELLFSKQNQDALSDRNLVLRKKFNIIDENSREEAAQISTETKAFFKKIGLKARIETITPQDYQGSLIQLKLQFVGNSDYHATFYYDPITEHYDLISIHPENPRFEQIREFLRKTGDIQGFLVNFRNFMLRSVVNDNPK